VTQDGPIRPGGHSNLACGSAGASVRRADLQVTDVNAPVTITAPPARCR
jgi:hypothetical protein